MCIEELKKNEVQSDLGGVLIWEVRDSLSKKVHLTLISEYSRSSHSHTHKKKNAVEIREQNSPKVKILKNEIWKLTEG